MTGAPGLSEYCGGGRPPGPVFDEMCADTGAVRGHWAYLDQALKTLGPQALAARQRDIARLLRDDGASYNVYNTPDGLGHPWGLDPIPMLISSEEWAGIEAGLLQRAELLNLVLADLYGSRTLIRKGLLPPELIYAHEGFVRPCATAERASAPRLTLYAADLVRGPDGGMRIVNDRTQAPSGLGYALENRTVMAKALPSLFREAHPHRLARFFRVLRRTLASLAGRDTDQPRIVVWTPGPLNETYFEHVYLASYLGYTLVEGADLAVREGRVWLRTLAGLEPVDVILRRVDALYCDPLELRPESRLGVAGLVETARRGTVAMANPLGAGVLENPGLMPFLPTLARHFFGHDLSLPSAATWWCGQPAECDYVLDHLQQLVIRPINRGMGNTAPVFGEQLSRAELEQWRARIRRHPYLYVGQERLTASTVPVVANGGLQPRPATLRAYLVEDEDSFTVMPGGLTRVGMAADNLLISNQAGATSKDTWVLASEPERQESLWPSIESTASDRGDRTSLSSRAAENLFWMSRYAERAEQTIRMLRIVQERLYESLQLATPAETACLHALLKGLTHLTGTYPGFLDEGAAGLLAQPEPELHTLIVNRSRTGTLASNLVSLISAVQSVRDLLSADTLRVVNDIEDTLLRLDELPLGSVGLWQDSLDRLVTSLMALSGLSHESICRDEAWHFLQIGRRIERASLGITLIRALVVPAAGGEVETLLWESLLSATESLGLYRRRHRTRPRPETALELVMLDVSHPRSLSYQLESLRRHLEALPGQRGGPWSPELKATLEGFCLLNLADIAVLAGVDESSGLRQDLEARTSRLLQIISGLASAIGDHYFVQVQGPYQL